MRIAVVNLTSGGFSGGYRKHLGRVIPRLAEDRRVSDLRLFGPRDAGLPVPASLHWERSGRRRWPRSRDLRHEVTAYEPDVVFIPSARWTPLPFPVVIMVRNMEPLTVPLQGNSLPDAARNLARRAMARWSCARATRIIAVSDHVRNFLVGEWGVDRARIGRVYHGVDVVPDPESKQPEGLKGRDGAPFVFTAGSIRPARGLEDLIFAMARLSAAGIRANLVVAGAPSGSGQTYRSRMDRLAAGLGVADRLIWLGEISAPELNWAFTHAAAFVMTTRAEACPNLALEAMSVGATCVAVSAPPMPEVMGDAARYYPAGDGDALAGILRRTLSHPGGPALAERARQQAARFTWDRTAKDTLAELEKALS